MPNPLGGETDGAMAEDSGEKSPGFGSLLAEIRRSLGLSQRRLAAKSGHDFGGLSRIESGRRTPHLETMRKLIEGLELDEGDPRRDELLRAAFGRRALGSSRSSVAARIEELESQLASAHAARLRTEAQLADLHERVSQAVLISGIAVLSHTSPGDASPAAAQRAEASVTGAATAARRPAAS